jgi:hypothetical protein
LARITCFQAALALSTTLVSPKFSKKIAYCATLAELRDKLGLDLDVPNFVAWDNLMHALLQFRVVCNVSSCVLLRAHVLLFPNAINNRWRNCLQM